MEFTQLQRRCQEVWSFTSSSVQRGATSGDGRRAEGRSVRERSDGENWKSTWNVCIDRGGVHQVRQATRTTETAYPGLREHRFLLELNTVNRPKLFETACKEGREIENAESSFNDSKAPCVRSISVRFYWDNRVTVPGTMATLWLGY